MILALLAALLTAQAPPAKKGRVQVAVTPRLEKAEVAPGTPFKVEFDVVIPPGWHIYPTVKTTTGTPTKFVFENADVVAPLEEPKPKTHPAADGLPAYDYHEGKVTLTATLKLKDGAAPGPLEIKGLIDYQICKDVCLPAKTPVAFPVTVVAGQGEAPEKKGAVVPPPPPEEKGRASSVATSELEKKGLLAFFLLAVGGGLVSLIQPCVFPLLPITVTYFVKQGGGSRSKTFMLSLVYAAGVIAAFTIVGFVASLALGESGARVFASNVWVNVVVALLFFWFAFSLFGLYEISLPSWLVGGLTSQKREGTGGAFILGTLFSIVTFTCTVPIAGTILAVTASSNPGHRFIGLTAMLIYSAVMALPFVLLGAFPALANVVRKSGGGWLHTTKVTMAFVEFGLAFYYLSKADVAGGWSFLTRDVMIGIWVGVLAVTALYLLRVFTMKGDDETAPRQIGVGRLMIALGFAFLAVMFARGFNGGALGELGVLTPPNLETASSGGGRAEGAEVVFHSLPEGMAEASKSGKPVFLEFTGVTCANCQRMKNTVLASAKVKSELSKFVFVELYTDRQDARNATSDAENSRLLNERFGSPALPVYIVLGPDGRERSRLEGLATESAFLAFLAQGETAKR